MCAEYRSTIIFSFRYLQATRIKFSGNLLSSPKICFMSVNKCFVI